MKMDAGELNNIQEGPVDDVLFQVPQNYQKGMVSAIDMGDTEKGATQSSSAPRDETVMLIDMAKLEYTKRNKADALPAAQVCFESCMAGNTVHGSQRAFGH